MDNLTTKNFKEVCERIKAGLDETGIETKNSLDIITEKYEWNYCGSDQTWKNEAGRSV